MENLVTMAVPLIVGLVIGIVIGRFLSKSTSSPKASATAEKPVWWQKREALTGTQMQILQFMEAKKEATIVKLQEKFSFIPDRELFYRLEQIVLMGFMTRSRVAGEVIFVLDQTYISTVESDKTIMLGGD
ncbi:MAG: hypothetical protein ACI9FB_001315 [Candidatus Azotimanducaceae bacterium]|jgi:hypothetical protein